MYVMPKISRFSYATQALFCRIEGEGVKNIQKTVHVVYGMDDAKSWNSRVELIFWKHFFNLNILQKLHVSLPISLKYKYKGKMTISKKQGL